MRAPRAIGGRRARRARLKLAPDLDRRNRQDHGITGRHRYLLAHRCSRAADGIGDEAKGCETTDETPWHDKAGLVIPRGGAESHALPTTRGIHVHVEEALVIHLEHGWLVLIGRATMRKSLAGGSAKNQKRKSDRWNFHGRSAVRTVRVSCPRGIMHSIHRNRSFGSR
jgi:hypothetical protein